MADYKKDPNLPPKNDAQRLGDLYQSFYQPGLLLILLIASWWTSYTGVLAMAEWITGASEMTRNVVLLVTASAMAAQYALWHYAMRLIPLYATHRAKGIGLLVVSILIVLLGLSSSYTSFIGTSSDSARALELQEQSDTYADAARRLSNRAAAMEDALFAISPQAAASCVRYDEELNDGVITGASGQGTVTNALLGLCQSKSAIAKALENTISESELLVGEIARLSAALDRIIYQRDVPMAERELSFLSIARQIDALLQELQNTDRTRGLRATSSAAANSIAVLDEAGTGLSQNQARALSAISQEELASSEAIANLIAEIEALPLPEAGRAKLLPAQVLVLKHWHMHLPQLALALAVDLFAPLSTLLFLAAAIRVRTRAPKPPKGPKL